MSAFKDLNPQLFSMGPDYIKAPTDDLAQAHSVEFDCPGCAGKPWTHRIWAPFLDQAPVYPGPSWRQTGTSIETLTFVDAPDGHSRSIRMLSGCASHFNITNGVIDFYEDSGHEAYQGRRE